MPRTVDPLPLLVLAGGHSRRMGCDKAALSWDGVPLLLRVIDRLAPIASQVWVSARPGQDLPAGAYRRVDDERPGDGPLAGLARALAAIDAGAVPVAVAACDYPFAEPGLFAALLAAAPAAAVVVPRVRGRSHPLLAVWRSDVASTCERALARGVRRVREVLDEVAAIEIEVSELPGIDADRTFLNVNDRETFERATALAARASAPPPD
jgi:molybdopterin-guanine dinucleotide biosynthesis protein A